MPHTHCVSYIIKYEEMRFSNYICSQALQLHCLFFFLQFFSSKKSVHSTQDNPDVIRGYLNRLNSAEGAQLSSLFSILGVCSDLLCFVCYITGTWLQFYPHY